MGFLPETVKGTNSWETLNESVHHMASMDLKTGNKVEGQGQAPSSPQCRRGKVEEQCSAVCDGAFLDCNLVRLASLVCVSKRGRADGAARDYFRTFDGSHAPQTDMSVGPEPQQ